jgi:prepilin-type processing-associated H-X9-DG protein
MSCYAHGVPLTYEAHWPLRKSGYISRADFGRGYDSGNPTDPCDGWYDSRLFRIDSSFTGQQYTAFRDCPNSTRSYLADYIYPIWLPGGYPQLSSDRIPHADAWNVWFLDGHVKRLRYKFHYPIENWFPTPWRRTWNELFDSQMFTN